jgi:cell division septum initiation protein DivIVA
MNTELLELAKTVQLNEPHNEKLRWAFALACANLVRHLVENPDALAALDILQRYVDGHVNEQERIAAAESAAHIAQHHRGSTSIDGTAHAFVSATYAVANALAGKAIETADYAAYATVYNYGAYALNDPSSFDEVHRWQVNALRELATLPSQL